MKLPRLHHVRHYAPGPPCGQMTRILAVGPVSYLSLRFDGEYAPVGVHRSLWIADRVGVLAGPEHGIAEGIPWKATRERWLRRGAHAIAICLVPAAGQMQEPRA